MFYELDSRYYGRLMQDQAGSNVRVVLEGLPERVHEIADALDRAMPDTFEWLDFASFSDMDNVVLKGLGSRDVAIKDLVEAR